MSDHTPELWRAEPMTDAQALKARHLTRPEFVDIAIARIPCGIETAEEALADQTLVHINAPRALMIVEWKGVVRGLALAEQALARETAAVHELIEAASAVIRGVDSCVDAGVENIVDGEVIDNLRAALAKAQE